MAKLPPMENRYQVHGRLLSLHKILPDWSGEDWMIQLKSTPDPTIPVSLYRDEDDGLVYLWFKGTVPLPFTPAELAELADLIQDIPIPLNTGDPEI